MNSRHHIIAYPLLIMTDSINFLRTSAIKKVTRKSHRENVAILEAFCKAAIHPHRFNLCLESETEIMASQENTAIEVECTVARIAEKKEEWAQIPIAQKLAVLLQVNPLRIPLLV